MKNIPWIFLLITGVVSDWTNDVERVLVPGSATVAGVYNLRPSTKHHFRLIAENEGGASDPSSTVTIVPAEEVPSGPPRGVKAEALDQSTLKITWKPPAREHWNGDILGYYVGYKLGSSDKPFLFEVVKSNRDQSKEHSLQINNLKTYTEYSAVVQAFNKVGDGPMSEEVSQYTGEGTPDQPPQDFTCNTLTSTTIGVSWSSPPLANANGIIKGYKVVYAPARIWFDDASKDTKITSQSETVLHGLKKYTNYTITVLAYTGGGDGVKAVPVHCYTEQDVPGPPQSVKALQMSPESILISWLAPEHPNGIITRYTVYVQESKGEEARSHRVPSFQLSFEASGLKKDRYNFWVTASTVIGEGEQSKQVSISPSSRVPAKIASFDHKFTVNFKDDIKLPCQAVGTPVPELQWKIKGSAFVPSDRHRLLPDGSLLIREVSRDDAGEYTCSVENNFGHDTISQHLTVHAPPRPPAVSLTSSTTSSISIKLKPKKEETPPIHAYVVHYKPEFGEWEQVQIASSQLEYTVDGLQCGQKYQLYASAQNSIGTGEGSEIIHTRTKGSAPAKPEASKFLEPSSNRVTLHLGTFSDGGCPMLYFVVEYKMRVSSDWTLVTNSLKPGGNFVVLDLAPGTWYNLKVTAHNNAGFAVAEFDFATLTATGDVGADNADYENQESDTGEATTQSFGKALKAMEALERSGALSPDMDIEARIKAVIEHFKSDDPKGIPGYPIPDPMDIPDASPDVGGTSLKLSESKLYGLSKISLTHVRVDFVRMKFEVGLAFPELMMQGRYRMSSWLSSSAGPYNITIIGVTMGSATELIIDEDGRIKVNDISLDFKFKDFNINFENLGFLGSIFQAILNSLITTIFDSVKPMIQGQVSTQVQQQVNDQMRSLQVVMYDSISPIDKIFIDVRNSIRKDGYEPLPLPDFYLPIFGGEEDHDYSNPLDANVLALKDGFLSGISTIYRADNMTITYDHMTKAVTADINLAMRKVGAKYNWELITGWYKRSGKMDFKIDGVVIGMSITQPANLEKQPFINKLSVKMGNIQVNSRGAGALDYLTEFTVNAGLNGLRHGIMAATQEVIQLVVNEELKAIDIENAILVEFGIGKKEEEE